eukprot:g1865.t1
MPAAFMHGARDVRLGRKAVPGPASLGPGEVLVNIEAVGICGSDLHYYKDGGIGAATIDSPFVPGHEFSARLCDDVPELGLAAGARVAVDPAMPCGSCEWCHAAQHNLCPHVQFTGAPPLDGALTQRVPLHHSQLFAVPDAFDAIDTLMLEPLGVAVHAADLARPQLLETVCILGCGPIGLLVSQLCALAGVARLILVDPIAARARHAVDAVQRSCAGVDAVAASSASDVARATGGRGADLVIEATNNPCGFADAADAARIGGRVVLVGIPDGNLYGQLDASLLRRKALEIKLSRRMGDVVPRAIELVRGGKVDVKAMVTHEFPLEQAAEAFAQAAAVHADAEGMTETEQERLSIKSVIRVSE